MKAIRFVLGSFLFVAFFASASMAQAQRTFVSGLGSDGNPCSRTAPCRTFTQAISQTDWGGEVYVLDSAGYGAFSINQSISIVAPPGVTAGISVFTGDGIDINAGGAGTVVLRGLTVTSRGTNGSGIRFNTGRELHVENCVVSGFAISPGLFFNGAGALEVKDSIMRNNDMGILVQPSSGTADATIDQVRLERNGNGLWVREGARVTVRNSIASASFGTGFVAISKTTANAELNIETCVASNNGNGGIIALNDSSGAATVRVSNSTVTDNHVGLSSFPSPSVILSRGNNTVEGNGTDTAGTIGSYSAK